MAIDTAGNNAPHIRVPASLPVVAWIMALPVTHAPLCRYVCPLAVSASCVISGDDAGTGSPFKRRPGP